MGLSLRPPAWLLNTGSTQFEGNRKTAQLKKGKREDKEKGRKKQLGKRHIQAKERVNGTNKKPAKQENNIARKLNQTAEKSGGARENPEKDSRSEKMRQN